MSGTYSTAACNDAKVACIGKVGTAFPQINALKCKAHVNETRTWWHPTIETNLFILYTLETICS